MSVSVSPDNTPGLVSRGQHSSRRLAGRRRLAMGLIVLVVSSGLTVLAVGSPAKAQSRPNSCPEMNDSITRLYRAYFLRAPDTVGFHYWTGLYQRGESSLEEVSDYFFRSREFQARYGYTSNDEFVELVYRNVMNRAPDPDGRRHWVDALERGYRRGQMMLAFSESEEFVRRTGTRTPLAGYLRWYPAGTRWYCGTGPAELVSVQPLIGDPLFADHLVRNDAVATEGSTQTTAGFGLYTVEGGVRNVTMAEGSLPPGTTDYRWDGAFSGDGFYGSGINVEVSDDTSWIVVFYPTSIGRERKGWSLVD